MKIPSARELGAFYGRCAAMFDAGLSCSAILDTAASGRGDAAGLAADLRRRIDAGDTLSEAMRNSARFPPLDVAVTAAGEKSGRTAEIMLLLSRFYERKSRFAARIKSRMVFPALVFTLALFVVSAPPLLLGTIGTAGYLLRTVGVIAALLLLVAAARILYGFGGPVSQNVLDRVPFVSGLVRGMALERFLHCLGMLLEAGLVEDLALESALGVVSFEPVRKVCLNGLAAVRAGRPLSSAYEAEPLFAGLPLNFLKTGEESGQLPEMLARAADSLGEKTAARLQALSSWLPRLVYAVVALYIIYSIFSLVSGYYVPSLRGLQP
ncbi:MAG: type II secretion system F family protein [Planctomycetes bacterium]|nr:type II secretion system F family protein [Planctomycetota bacterium]